MTRRWRSGCYTSWPGENQWRRRRLPRRPAATRAERWVANHRGAVALTLDDAFELGHLATQPLLAAH
jgi:hypothetical protein